MSAQLRPALPADHSRFVRFFAELELDDPVPEPSQWERDMMPYSTFLEVDGACVGYAMFKAGGSVGHVYHVVVDPRRRGEGHGKRLMEHVAERFQSEGCNRWCLNVKPENTAARALYERFGMHGDYESSVLRLRWSQAAMLAASEGEPWTRPLSPADDGELEKRFALLPGQVGFSRSKSSTVLLGVGGAGTSSCEGFASFDPSFPGAFPFRVARLSLARPLLLALKPHARPMALSCVAGETPDRWRTEGLQVVVENHDDLTSLLQTVGAERTLRILHYVGDVP